MWTLTKEIINPIFNGYYSYIRFTNGVKSHIPFHVPLIQKQKHAKAKLYLLRIVRSPYVF